jgi:hypothetical protein
VAKRSIKDEAVKTTGNSSEDTAMAPQPRLAFEPTPSPEPEETAPGANALGPRAESDSFYQPSPSDSPARMLQEQLVSTFSGEAVARSTSLRRWSARRTLLFVVSTSGLLWGLIAWGVYAAIR